MTDLARKLAEHPRWRWEPGMVDADGYLVVHVDNGRLSVMHRSSAFVGNTRATSLTPDLNHPATKGWLLAMLREAWETETVLAYARTGWCPEFETRAWFELESYKGHCVLGSTEGEALARALLAAWGSDD